MIENGAYLMLAGELHYEPYLKACIALASCPRWIDLGAGVGRVARRVSGSFHVDCTAVDAVLPEVPSSAGWSFRTENIEKFLSRFQADGGALISLLDVIEHFDRATGENVLAQVCRLSGAQVVFTPWGFYPQDPRGCPELVGVPEMWHRSGWGIQDFLDRGFVVLSLPMYHRRRGALFAFRKSSWSDAERLLATRVMRNLYFRRMINPIRAFRRLRSAIFYWFGNTPLYDALRTLLRQAKRRMSAPPKRIET